MWLASQSIGRMTGRVNALYQGNAYAETLGQVDLRIQKIAERPLIVHRVRRWKAPWVLVQLRLTRWLQLGDSSNMSMAAVALAIHGGGALSSFATTVLLTVDETIDALRKAEQIRYRAPGA